MNDCTQTESYGVDPHAETVVGGARPYLKEKANPTKYDVYVVFMGKRMKGGVVVFRKTCHGEGWQFIPRTQESPSRKLWPTPEGAVKKRWPNAELVPV